MYVAPRRISAGEPVTAFGRLVCHRQERAADQVVRLFTIFAACPEEASN